MMRTLPVLLGWIYLVCIAACSAGAEDSDNTDPAENTDADAGGKDTDTIGNTDSETDSSSEIVYENTGICRMAMDATVTMESFDGFEDDYLVGDEGDGEDICRVQFEIHSVGTPSTPCTECLWTFIVEKSNPTVLTDVNDGCANSELNFDADQIAEEDGKQISYGYVLEDTGHGHVLLRLNEATGVWSGAYAASWDDISFELYYDQPNGWCGY